MNENEDCLLTVDKQTKEIVFQKMKDFQGLSSTLESALGALVIGQYLGWRILRLTHNPATYRRYEKVLGIKFQDVCPEITDLGKRKSIGYAITEKLGSFWAVIMGRIKVPNKGNLANEDEVKRIAEAFKESSK